MKKLLWAALAACVVVAIDVGTVGHEKAASRAAEGAAAGPAREAAQTDATRNPNVESRPGQPESGRNAIQP